MTKQVNVWSRKANELLKSHNLPLRAKGSEFLGCVALHGDRKFNNAAEVVLSAAGFDTWTDGAGWLYAQKF